MALERTFEDIQLADVVTLAMKKWKEGWRCVQVLCTNTDDGIDMTYSYMLDNKLTNYRVKAVKKGTPVPSIQGIYLGVFPFENEAHDLFGVDVEGMVLDFGGNFYSLAEKEPMTVITPEKKAARERAAKVAKAKEAKAAKDAAAQAAAPAPAANDSAPAAQSGKDGE